MAQRELKILIDLQARVDRLDREAETVKRHVMLLCFIALAILIYFLKGLLCV
jgi:hypothetical protein